MRTTRNVWAATVIALGMVAGGCAGDRTAPASGPSTTTAAPSTAQRIVAPRATSFPTTMGTVHLECHGSGTVPVVLIAGTDDPIRRWDGLVDDLGHGVLTCRFDADEAAATGSLTGSVTPGARADALASALVASGLPAPYVLVGHSLGGLTVRQFGADHGAVLGGALLLDPTTPTALASLHPQLTEMGWDADATQAEADGRVGWPEVPLVVLSHDPTEAPLGDPVIENLWTQGQEDYGALTGNAVATPVPGAGHYVDRDAPAQVTRAIDDLVRQAGPS